MILEDQLMFLTAGIACMAIGFCWGVYAATKVHTRSLEMLRRESDFIFTERPDEYHVSQRH